MPQITEQAPVRPGRRRRDDVRAAVRAAMVELASRKAFKNLTVDELARAAGISRTAFYFYYRDKHEVLMAIADELASEMYGEADHWWHGAGPPEELIRAAIEGIAAAYHRHAGVLRAALEAANYDRGFARFYRSLVGRFVTATAEHLRRERAAGRLRPLDPDTAAEALVWMLERCNQVLLASEGRSPRDLVDSLTAIWLHTLYPDSPGRSS